MSASTFERCPTEVCRPQEVTETKRRGEIIRSPLQWSTCPFDHGLTTVKCKDKKGHNDKTHSALAAPGLKLYKMEVVEECRNRDVYGVLGVASMVVVQMRHIEIASFLLLFEPPVYIVNSQDDLNRRRTTSSEAQPAKDVNRGPLSEVMGVGGVEGQSADSQGSSPPCGKPTRAKRVKNTDGTAAGGGGGGFYQTNAAITTLSAPGSGK
ncbi:hypothetical protein L218DRAFT_949561 [Marasmius fiardii PR-910]|nr:hypothetical protein L218DRAFT_949561 [Marasmius fiardii PR-910]